MFVRIYSKITFVGITLRAKSKNYTALNDEKAGFGHAVLLHPLLWAALRIGPAREHMGIASVARKTRTLATIRLARLARLARRLATLRLARMARRHTRRLATLRLARMARP